MKSDDTWKFFVESHERLVLFHDLIAHLVGLDKDKFIG